jgi:hypothetical protein
MDFIERLLSMIDGPAALRFVVQPAVAVLLGVHAGLLDARAEREPYVLRLVTGQARGAALREGAKQVLVPFVIAIVLDITVSALLFGRVFPLASLLIGGFLVGLPYALARGLSNRLSRRLTRRPRTDTSLA